MMYGQTKIKFTPIFYTATNQRLSYLDHG